jgi:hypothetical protein
MDAIHAIDDKTNRMIKKAVGCPFNEIYLQRYFERGPFTSSFDSLII